MSDDDNEDDYSPLDDEPAADEVEVDNKPEPVRVVMRREEPEKSFAEEHPVAAGLLGGALVFGLGVMAVASLFIPKEKD
jgi:hypothetical protein